MGSRPDPARRRGAPRPRPIQIEYDEDSGLVMFVDELNEEGEAAFCSGEGEEPVVVYAQALLPRAPGFFMVAGTFGGEVSALTPRSAPIIEFEFDEHGRAVSFTIRTHDDELAGTGVRAAC